MQRKYELYREAQRQGAGFVANVILTGMSKPTKKLAGLVNLLNRGIMVSTAQFDLYVLQFDGAGQHSYAELEKLRARVIPRAGFSPLAERIGRGESPQNRENQ